MPNLKKALLFFLGLVAVYPVVFASTTAFNDLIVLFVLVLLFYPVFAWNILVVFLVQKVFLKDFFKKMRFDEILGFFAKITIIWFAGVIPGSFFMTLRTAFYLSFAVYALPITAFEFLYLMRKMSRKEAGILALSLGLLSNPALFSPVLGLLNAQLKLVMTTLVVISLLIIMPTAVLYRLWKTRKTRGKDRQALVWLIIVITLFLVSAAFWYLISIPQSPAYAVCENFKTQVSAMCAVKPNRELCEGVEYRTVLPGQLGTDNQCVWDNERGRCAVNEKEINWSDSDYCN